VVAKKLFHIVVGLWFSAMVANFSYLIGAGLYVWLAGLDPESNAPLLFMFPRFAMILSVALPLAFGIAMFGQRRFVAIGAILFGLAASVCWYVMGSRG
jgi:hypothetical protein